MNSNVITAGVQFEDGFDAENRRYEMTKETTESKVPTARFRQEAKVAAVCVCIATACLVPTIIDGLIYGDDFPVSFLVAFALLFVAILLFNYGTGWKYAGEYEGRSLIDQQARTGGLIGLSLDLRHTGPGNPSRSWRRRRSKKDGI